MVRLEKFLLLCSSGSVFATSYIQYSTVTGYFLQNQNSTNAATFDYTATNLGLINQSCSTDPANAVSLSQWQRFANLIFSFRAEASKKVDYKLIFIGRHGEGYHNAVESYYGPPAWNCYWSLLDGNDTVVWADAHLTGDGIEQNLKINRFWHTRINDQKIHTPQSYYVSLLSRCLATANLTLPLPPKHSFIPTIKAKLREGISEHTCDRRSNRTYIAESVPTYKFENGFPKYDQLWTGVTAETSQAQDYRSKQLPDDIFPHDHSNYLSFTSHSG